MKIERMLRVNELLQRELGALVERDVRPYTRALVTITAAKTSPDLQHADIYVSIMATEEAKRQEAFAILQKCRKEFQHELGIRIKLKYTPVLRFHLDLLSEKADRVLMLMEQLNLHPETASQPDAAGPDAGVPTADDAKPA